MAYVYFFRPDIYHERYNCSAYNVTDIPLENRQHIAIGAIFLSCGLFMEFLYFPCMIAIRKHMDSTCFKFMFYISISDMMCLVVNAIITGWLSIVGAVYCTYPRFIYFAGSAGLALWGCETVAEMILAINRCIELSSRTWAEFLFHGKRTYLWMIVPTVYGLWFFIFEMPIHFSGIFVSWFFNPHVGYLDDFGKKYYSHLHTVHNYFVIVMLSSTYFTFATILSLKTMKHKISTSAQTSRAQKMTFVQVILISSINAVAAAIYVYMQFARISEVLILIGQFTWMLAHGMPPVIYLALNKTVRRDVYRMCVRVIPCVNPPPLHSSIASVAGGLPPSNTRNRVGPSSNVGPSIH
uniref:Serpentine Receptor, class T n=2 Tax=Meloidogyne TaxID=189290 RepID=A0A914M645_MELIC